MVTKWEEWKEKQKTDKEKTDGNEGSRAWWVWLSNIIPCLLKPE